MIQAPQNYGMQQPVQNSQQARKPAFSPSYNAVQINLDTPTLNAPPSMPYYPPVNMETRAPQPQPQVAPVNQPVVTAEPQQSAPVVAPAQVPPPVVTAEPQQAAPVVAPAQEPVKVVTPETVPPQTIVDEAFKGLNDANYDVQAATMENIAKLGLPEVNADGSVKEPKSENLVPYVQENIFDKLIEIMNVDSSSLAGPTPEQIDFRNKIAENDKVKADAQAAGKDAAAVKLPHNLSQEQIENANMLSPFEQVERNKEYAMFTTAILQKTYADEIQKQTGVVPPLTELPGSKAVITQLKSNPSSEMAISAIDALRFVQRPEYKADLTTLYTIAKNDARPEVEEAATQALASLNDTTPATK